MRVRVAGVEFEDESVVYTVFVPEIHVHCKGAHDQNGQKKPAEHAKYCTEGERQEERACVFRKSCGKLHFHRQRDSVRVCVCECERERDKKTTLLKIKKFLPIFFETRKRNKNAPRENKLYLMQHLLTWNGIREKGRVSLSHRCDDNHNTDGEK